MQNMMKKVEQTCIAIVSLLLPLWYCYSKGLGYFSEYFPFGIGTNYLDETDLLVTGCAFFLVLIYLAWRGHVLQIKNKKWVWLSLLPIGVGIIGFTAGCNGLHNLVAMRNNIPALLQMIKGLEFSLVFPLLGIVFSVFFLKACPYIAILFGCTSMGLAGGSYDMLQAFAGMDLAVDLESLLYDIQVIWSLSKSTLLICVGFGLVLCLACFILKRIKPTKKNLVMQESTLEGRSGIN